MNPMGQFQRSDLCFMRPSALYKSFSSSSSNSSSSSSSCWHCLSAALQYSDDDDDDGTVAHYIELLNYTRVFKVQVATVSQLSGIMCGWRTASATHL